MFSIRKVILAAVVCALFALPCMADASFEFNLPVSVRSYGMAGTGTADTTDVANIAYNPAIVSMLTGVHFTAAYMRYNYSWVHSDARGGFIGGGYRWKINDSYSVGVGAAAGHVWRRYGFEGTWLTWSESREGDDIDWADPTGAWYFSTGAMVRYRDVLTAGIGLSVKPYRHTRDGNIFVPGGICGPPLKTSANPVDAGFIVMATPYNRGGYRLTAAAGYMYSNLAGDIKAEGEGCPLTVTIDSEQFAFSRYGMSVTLAFPTWDHSYRRFQTELPKATVSVNYDYEDPVDRADVRAISAFGTELSLLQMLFLRVGFVSVKTRSWDYPSCGELSCTPVMRIDKESEPTWGVGLGFNKKRVHVRLDYGRTSEPDISDSVYNRFGLTLEVDR